jgi:DNA-binding transcriptional ArsR family regulator
VPASPDPASVFRALGDATRYTIAGMIAREPLTSAELARRLKVSNPTMAHHLRALRAAGLVTEEARGTSIVLSLDRIALEALSDAAVAQFFGPGGSAPIRRSRRTG